MGWGPLWFTGEGDVLLVFDVRKNASDEHKGIQSQHALACAAKQPHDKVTLRHLKKKKSKSLTKASRAHRWLGGSLAQSDGNAAALQERGADAQEPVGVGDGLGHVDFRNQDNAVRRRWCSHEVLHDNLGELGPGAVAAVGDEEVVVVGCSNVKGRRHGRVCAGGVKTLLAETAGEAGRQPGSGLVEQGVGRLCERRGVLGNADLQRGANGLQT